MATQLTRMTVDSSQLQEGDLLWLGGIWYRIATKPIASKASRTRWFRAVNEKTGRNARITLAPHQDHIIERAPGVDT